MASRDRDDAMAGLLKQSLAGDAGAGNDCPGPGILAAYFERSLAADETARLEIHFAQCAHCREQLAALARAESGAPPLAATTPREPSKAPRVSWLWDWRWLAPVAAVLVLTALWATRRPMLTRIAEQPTQAPAAVATSQPPEQPIQPAAQQATQQTRQPASQRLTAPAPGGNAGAAAQLPLAGRNFTPPDKLPKKAAAQQQNSADQAATAPSPAGTSESVTVESEAPSVGMPSAAPRAGNGAAAGAVGGVISSEQSSSAKQAPALVSGYRSRSEIVSANQAGVLATSNIIHAPDPRILWRIASGGFVERSEDVGATWKGQMPDENAHLVAGSAPGAKICWLVGDDGVILLTRDASNWQTIQPPVRADLVAVSAQDASSAMVTTADGRKFTTTNRGKSWAPAK